MKAGGPLRYLEINGDLVRNDSREKKKRRKQHWKDGKSDMHQTSSRQNYFLDYRKNIFITFAQCFKKNKTISSSLQPTVKLLEQLTFHQLVVTIQLYTRPC